MNLSCNTEGFIYRHSSPHSPVVELLATHYGSLLLIHPGFTSTDQRGLLLSLAKHYSFKKFKQKVLDLTKAEQKYVSEKHHHSLSNRRVITHSCTGI